jgi:hypothetical protein
MTTFTLGIDPGTTHSGVVLFNGAPISSAVLDNHDVLAVIRDHKGLVAIERVVSYGMPVGFETIQTVEWIGRFWQQAGPERVRLIPRKDVCKHVCNDGRAKDPHIRQALIDRWGGKAEAIGTIKKPGPLYAVKSHAWQALAVAVTAVET